MNTHTSTRFHTHKLKRTESSTLQTAGPEEKTHSFELEFVTVNLKSIQIFCSLTSE